MNPFATQKDPSEKWTRFSVSKEKKAQGIRKTQAPIESNEKRVKLSLLAAIFHYNIIKSVCQFRVPRDRGNNSAFLC